MTWPIIGIRQYEWIANSPATFRRNCWFPPKPWHWGRPQRSIIAGTTHCVKAYVAVQTSYLQKNKIPQYDDIHVLHTNSGKYPVLFGI